MPRSTNHAAGARQAMRDQDYTLALWHIREGLRLYRGGRSELGVVTNLLGIPAYGNLAAAFEADGIFKLMDRAAELACKAEETLRARLKPNERIQAHRQTSEAMKWLKRIVEEEGSIELATLDARAAQESITSLKSRIEWMQKAGTVHLVGTTVHPGAATPAPEIQAPSGKVPPFEGYLLEPTATQSSFFGEFARRVLSGETVDLEDQWGYAFELLETMTEELAYDLPALRATLKLLEERYPGAPIAEACREGLADIHFLREDWQSGFDLLHPELPMDVYLTLAPFVYNSRLQAETVEGWMTQSQMVSNMLRSRKDEVDSVLQDLLDASHRKLGRSLVEDLWARLIEHRPKGSSGPTIEQEFGGFITQEKINEYLELFDRGLYNRPRTAFQGRTVNWPMQFRSTYWFDQIARARFQALYRDAENIVRRSMGLPPVGEGWVAEVLLLQAVREAFPEHRIVHQGRPSWLAPQSLDIFLPDQNIGIEYQGTQHSRPVEIFGGQLGFERQVERDTRKRDLCQKYRCLLIEVHPNYDIEEVLREVRALLTVDLQI